MVSHLGLRTHKLVSEEIGNINAEIVLAREGYEAVANYSQPIFTLTKITGLI